MNSIRIIKENLIDYNETASDFTSRAHFHTHYEIYYMVRGKRRYFINNEIFDVSSGDIIAIPEQVIHKVTKSPDYVPGETHSRILFSPSHTMIPFEFIPCFNQHLYHLNEDECKIVENSFHEGFYEIHHHHSYSACLIQASLIRILKILEKHYVKQDIKKEMSQNDILMEEASRYILKHFSEQLTLKKLAKQFGFSDAHFSVLFKQKTGFNFIEYLTNIRVIHAINLLKETNLPISDISTECGYGDSNYFSSVFKKTVGTTPLQYRIQNAEKADDL